MKSSPKRTGKISSVQRRKDPRPPVQNRAAAQDCTESAIDKTVQPTIVEVNIQDFRARMKAFCEGESAVLVGGAYRCRAIVLPVRRGWMFKHEPTEAKRARLSALLELALDKVLR